MLIAQVTTVHSRTDPRIRHKETATLSRMLDHDVKLFVQDGLGDETDPESGVRIVDIGAKPPGRIKRMIKGSWRMFRALRRAGADVVHFHDPELIFMGMALKARGVKVVYDVHEDLPLQVMTKHYVPRILRKPLSLTVRTLEWTAAQLFNGVVAATPNIADHFPPGKTVTVRNYPQPEKLETSDIDAGIPRPPHFAYIGGISAVRGTVEMVRSLEHVRTPGARLQLAGKFMPEAHRSDVATLDGWSRVDFFDWLSRKDVAALLGSVRAGIVTLHPTRSYVESLPVKLFEYMAAGLPVIASDFPIWREIIDEAQCGLLVDPMDPAAIAAAMDWIIENPQEAEEMGERGRVAIHERLNWGVEAARLVDFYENRVLA